MHGVEAVEQFVVRQKIAKQYLQNPWALQIIDDCTDDSKIFKKPLFQAYYKNGRHWHMVHILTLQYSLGIPPDIRNNFNFVFLMGEDSSINRKKLFDHWCSIVPNLKLFEQIFLEVTQNYGCLVINNTIKTSDITQRLFWFRARKLSDFKVGSNKFKIFHEENYDNEHDKIIERIHNAKKENKDHYRVKTLQGDRMKIDAMIYQHLLELIYP